MTSGNAATARVWLIVWCKTFGHQVEPDLAEMAASYGANTSVLDWPDRPIRSGCGGRNVDMVVMGPNGDIRMLQRVTSVAQPHTEIINMASFDAEHVL